MERRSSGKTETAAERGRKEEMTLLQHEISIQAGIKTSNKVTPLTTGVSKPTK